MTLELPWQRSDPITYFTPAMILGTGNVTKSFTGAFFSNTVALMFVKFKKTLRALSRYFGMKFLLLEIRTEKENLDVWPLSVQNEALLTCIFTP